MKQYWIREWKDSQPDGFLSGDVAEENCCDCFTEAEDNTVHVIEATPILAAIKQFEREYNDMNLNGVGEVLRELIALTEGLGK